MHHKSVFGKFITYAVWLQLAPLELLLGIVEIISSLGRADFRTNNCSRLVSQIT